MLPPVRAALSPNIDYQGFSPTAAARQRGDVATSSVSAETDMTVPLSGGRLDALSLSAQLKLAQSFSVFAETIGRLLKIPRRENEALVDYAARLSNAMQALKPSERATIERLLNEIVKGTSLRLLAEILKNPAGPEAARLAVYMETANPSERDLAAKAVVSSYRQNGSAELPAGSGNPRSVPANGQAAPPAAATGPDSATARPSAVADLPSVTQPSSADSPDQADRGQPPRNPAETGQAKNGSSTPHERQISSRSGSAAVPSPVSPGPALPGPDLKVPLTGTALRSAETFADASRHPHPEGFGGAAGEPAEDPVDDRPPSRAERDKETAAPARRAGEAATRTLVAFPAVGASGTDRKMPELAGLMSGIAAEADLPGAGRLTDRNAAPLQTTAAPANISDGRTGATARSGEGASAFLPSAAEPTEGAAGEFAAGSHRERSTGPAVATDLVERQAGQLPGAWPPVAREGVPWPYVAYPPAEEEPRREERKARPIAEIGDEEADAPPQDHGFHGDEQEEAENDGGEHDDAPSGDEEEGRPNDLYWRMAGWT